MTPAMRASLGGRRIMIAGLVSIALPDHTIRLCDGSAAIRFGDDVFTGRDEIYGVLGEVEVISEAVGDQVPAVEMTLIPPSLAAAAALANPVNQGAPVLFWLASIDAETGEVVPDPDLQFTGEIDTAQLETDRGKQAVRIGVASVFERLLEPDEGARLSDSFQQEMFPGDLGLSNMTGTPLVSIWGPGDRPPATTMVPQFPRTGVQRYL